MISSDCDCKLCGAPIPKGEEHLMSPEWDQYTHRVCGLNWAEAEDRGKARTVPSEKKVIGKRERMLKRLEKKWGK